MDTLIQDLRYSARLLWKKRGYSVVVILTLALGIGAVTSVFSVVDAVLLKPYGPVNTDQWVYLWEHRMNSQSLIRSAFPFRIFAIGSGIALRSSPMLSCGCHGATPLRARTSAIRSACARP